MLTDNFNHLRSQSEVPDGEVKVSPQNLTLFLRPGILLYL